MERVISSVKIYIFRLVWVFQVIADQDLAGPLVFCLLFGAALLLHGKVYLRI